jgi:phage head maturation protease
MSGGLHRLDIALKAVEDGKFGGFEAILSTPTLDRDGEVVDPKAFDPLPPRIPIDVDHGMSVVTTVGSGAPFYDGDVLKIRGVFASTPLAQEVRALVKEGHIDRMSVAFMNPVREAKDGVPHVVRAELLNAGIVCIPSNREAAITGAKRLAEAAEVRMAGDRKLGARNSSKDAERLQAAHDLLVENGALCGKSKAHGRRPARDGGPVKTFKSATGSFEHRTELLRVAIREAHPDAYWVQVLATFEDTVTYALNGFEDDVERFTAPYELVDGVVTLGPPEPLGGPADEMDPEDPAAEEIPEEGPAAPAAGPAPASTSALVARALADDLEVFLT